MQSFAQTANYEHSFWLQILRDHSQFILDALVEKEKQEIEVAKNFIQIFNGLLVSLKNGGKLEEITKNADKSAQDLRSFKLNLLQKKVTSDFTFHLSSTFLNHMVNELEEYQLVLSYLKQNQIPPIFHELHHHLLWTLDAAGHAGAISDNLDATEKKLKKISDKYIVHFEQFYIKAVELTGYLRTNLSTFPALSKYNKDVTLEIKLFQAFLKEIEELELSHQMLGTFSALMADHMMREEIYYLKKVAMSTGMES